MIKFDREKVKQVFAEYTDRYDSSDEKIKLKINHTYRVADFCDSISDSIGLTGDDKEIAWLLGMLHDVGRFEQVKRYGTFSDSQSVDHAEFGADLLFAEGLLEDYVPGLLADPEKDLIELAIRQHNKYRIVEGLSERELMFSRIIRDADKIDIFRVNIDTPMEDIYDVTTEELMNSTVTPAVMDAFDEEHCILKSIRETAIDHLVGHISLAYELEFPVSLRIVVEQGYMQQMMNFKSDNPDTRAQFEHIREHMEEYISVRV